MRYLLLVLLLSSCASIMSGTSQNIMIDTPKVTGADCKLSDSKSGRWYMPSTPDSVTVTKGDGPLNVICSKANYKTTAIQVEEEVADAAFGNILAGGPIGVIVDASTGAAQQYPTKVVVWMEPERWQSEQAKKEWFAEKKKYEDELKAKAEAAKKSMNPNKKR